MYKDVQTQSSDFSLGSEEFCEAMRRFASIVGTNSCASEGRRNGMSATAITSLSTDPASLLVCVNKYAIALPVTAAPAERNIIHRSPAAV
jgi:flavin reductase (DIM6/NTAB) family NADH-FMN oxidoreductase RutF